jgi:formylmethanofuran dehydrogenase subunit E
MDPLISRADENAIAMIECRMCHRLVPREYTGTLSGRTLCFGCLSGWYDEDDED